jgi:hypothetical protein
MQENRFQPAGYLAACLFRADAPRAAVIETNRFLLVVRDVLNHDVRTRVVLKALCSAVRPVRRIRPRQSSDERFTSWRKTGAPKDGRTSRQTAGTLDTNVEKPQRDDGRTAENVTRCNARVVTRTSACGRVIPSIEGMSPGSGADAYRVYKARVRRWI